MRTGLTEEDIREVLARAEEIHLLGEPSSQVDIVRAAEEAGLPKEAVEQALRERFFAEPPKVGDMVFAPSSDGRHYVAEVLAESGSSLKVRFMKGSEATVRADSLKPCGFLPGEEVSVDWPWWGWWGVSVVSYDKANKSVQVTDGWSEEWFSLDKVRLDPPKTPKAKRKAALWAYTVVGLLSGIGGAVVAWIVLR
jgi:hypothetical protein